MIMHQRCRAISNILIHILISLWGGDVRAEQCQSEFYMGSTRWDINISQRQIKNQDDVFVNNDRPDIIVMLLKLISVPEEKSIEDIINHQRRPIGGWQNWGRRMASLWSCVRHQEHNINTKCSWNVIVGQEHRAQVQAVLLQPDQAIVLHDPRERLGRNAVLLRPPERPLRPGTFL